MTTAFFDDDEPFRLPGPSGLAEPGDAAARRSDAATLHAGPVPADGDQADDGLAERVRRLVDRAREKHRAGEYQTAIGLCDQALALDPSFLPAWRWKAHSLVALRNLDLAIRELTKARVAVAEAKRAAVDEMIDACRRHLTDRPVEDARQAFRHGEPGRAATILAGCAEAFGADEEYQARLTYASERAAAAVARQSGSASTELTHAVLQRVLAWIAREELDGGDEALAAEDYRTAANLYSRARRRDPRHTEAALGESLAVYRFAVTRELPSDLDKYRAGLKENALLLRRAESLAREARADRGLAEVASAALTAIEESARQIADSRAWGAKVAAVNDCVDRYNALQRHFGSTARNWLSSSNFLTSFPPIEARAHQLLDKYGPDDPHVGKTLTELVAKVDEQRAHIRW